MPYTTEAKNNRVIFTITIPAETVTDAMQNSARYLSQNTNIPGFRQGKADYEIIKQRLGAMEILEAATEDLIRAAFVEAVLAEDLETVGQPYFNMIKTAPENEMIFTAEVSLMPKVKKLADYEKIKIEKKTTEPTPELIEQAKKDLTAMQTKEIRAPKGEKLKTGDKAVINLTMKINGVVIEGGEGRDHGIYTAETYYIAGFIEKILGMEEGETRNFTLPFPKDHYQKHIAGNPVDFTIELKEIFYLETPKIDNEFAKSIGLKDANELEGKLRENLKLENEHEESQRQDREILESIAGKSDFEEIPDMLVNQELEQMIAELKQAVSGRGLEFEEYLKQIKKNITDLKLNMTPGALTRIKVSLILKKIAKKEQIEIDGKTVEAELDKIAEHYKDDADTKKKIYGQEYRNYLEHQMRNRKTIDLLKNKIVK